MIDRCLSIIENRFVIKSLFGVYYQIHFVLLVCKALFWTFSNKSVANTSEQLDQALKSMKDFFEENKSHIQLQLETHHREEKMQRFLQVNTEN